MAAERSSASRCHVQDVTRANVCVGVGVSVDGVGVWVSVLVLVLVFALYRRRKVSHCAVFVAQPLLCASLPLRSLKFCANSMLAGFHNMWCTFSSTDNCCCCMIAVYAILRSIY